MSVRWRTVTDGSWDWAGGRFTGRSHTEWFDPAGRRLGEEWRRWAIQSGGRATAGQISGRAGANRLADRLMLASGLLVFAGSVVLRALTG